MCPSRGVQQPDQVRGKPLPDGETWGVFERAWVICCSVMEKQRTDRGWAWIKNTMVYPQGRTPFRPTRIKGGPMDGHYTQPPAWFFPSV